MVDHFDERVRNWVLSVAEGAEVWMGPPNVQRPGSGVGLYLLEVMKAPPPATPKRPAPLQLTLKYLVTAWSEKPEGANELLVKLILAAMENEDFEVETEALSMNLWTALGTPPRPSFLMRVPLSHERSAPPVKLVRHPLTVRMSPTSSFHGTVLGPDEIPLSECRVEIPALRLSTSTDYKGRFCFPCVPSEGTKNLLIKARGHILPVTTDGNYPSSGAPMVINFSSLEE
jgi:hypothetical protein